jgi:HK97 family phage portal protein
MSVLQRMLGAVWSPQGPGWTVRGATFAGEKVTVEGSLNLVPVFNAVSQISGAVATLPLPVYERDADYNRLVADDPAWRLLNEEANPEMASDEMLEIADSHIELWGNAFLYKRKLGGRADQLWPLSPSRVQVSRNEAGKRVFFIEGDTFGEETILHLRGLSLDGLVGWSPIQLARNAIANAHAQEKFQGRFLKEDGKPSVLLRHPNQISPEAQERLKAGWDATKSGGTAVLEEGIEVERWTMPLADAQFVEQMEFSDRRVAQIFNLAPSRIGAKAGDSLTYTTAESDGQRFVTSTLQRRLTRIERALSRDSDIFPDHDRFTEFDTTVLLRAALKERYEAYAVGMKAGFLDRDDIRPKENLARRAATAPQPSPENPGGDS